MRQQLGKLHPALAAWMKLVGRTENIARLLVEVDLQIATRISLTAPLVQRRLVIEQVHLARATMLEQTDNRAGFWAKVSRFRGIGRQRPCRCQKVSQRKRPESASGTAKKRAAGEEVQDSIISVHAHSRSMNSFDAKSI